MDRFNWSNFDLNTCDDFSDAVIRVMEFYDGDRDDITADTFDKAFERSYETKISRGRDRKEATLAANRSAILTIVRDLDTLRDACNCWLASRGPEEIQYAIELADLPSASVDDRTPFEKWQQFKLSETSKKHFEEDLSNSDFLYVEAITKDAVRAFRQYDFPEISTNVFECTVEELRDLVDQYELDPEEDVYIGTRFFKGRILGRLFDVYAALYDAC